jgi:hypothetical protein
MGVGRQIGAAVVGVFVFWAFVAAMSRLLSMKEMPAYIDNMTKGLSNLYRGAFAQ